MIALIIFGLLLLIICALIFGILSDFVLKMEQENEENYSIDDKNNFQNRRYS